MAGTAASTAALEVSISFGRFENELLSWEKWSSFSTNKYLEEVEKCAAPGSVAEKKAYFEAHYKKIATQKPELMELNEQVANGLFISDADHGQRDLNRSVAEADYEVNASAGLSFARGMEQTDFDRGVGQEMEIYEDELITIECHTFSAERGRVQDEPIKAEGEANLDIPDEKNVVKEVQEQGVIHSAAAVVASTADSQSKPQEDASDYRENAGSEMDSNAVPQKETGQLNAPKNATTKVSKEKNTPKIRKTSSLPLAKSPRITAPKVSKQVSVSTTSSASRVRTARSLPRSRKFNSPSTDSSKKVAPKSLHKSVSPGPASSPASAPTTIRKSFIMESMGNKDIVKRAFKMFENNVRNLDPPGCDRSPMSKQVPSRKTELGAASHYIVARKENGWAGSGAAAQRGPRASLPSFGVRSIEKPRVVPQHGKKFQEKPDAKSKLEEHKEADINTLRPGLNFRSAPLPASQRQSKMKNRAGGFQG